MSSSKSTLGSFSSGSSTSKGTDVDSHASRLTMFKWIQCTYGEVKAKEALLLPTSTVLSLYPEIAKFGPAAIQIEAFFSAVREALSLLEM